MHDFCYILLQWAAIKEKYLFPGKLLRSEEVGREKRRLQKDYESNRRESSDALKGEESLINSPPLKLGLS